MSYPNFFTIKCPKCQIKQGYYKMPNIVCDYCCFDIFINGELQSWTGVRKRKW